jgi:uncharacterized membrane protein YccC
MSIVRSRHDDRTDEPETPQPLPSLKDMEPQRKASERISRFHAAHQRQANVKLLNDFRIWAGANTAALWLCFRMTVAGLLAYLLAKVFALPKGYWAVFSAIIVIQASVGGSAKATIDRVIGTIGRAVAGGAVGFIVPHQNVFSLGRNRMSRA